MAGVTKRQAEYVPYAQRTELDKLSKADLMEIAYSLALCQTGREDFAEAYQIVKAEHEALCGPAGRKPIQLAENVLPLSREELYAQMVADGTAPEWMRRFVADTQED